MTSRLALALSLLSWRQLRLKPVACPMCGPSLIVRLNRDPTGVRCLRCGGSAIHMSIAEALGRRVTGLSGLHIYELSSRGAFFDYLGRFCRNLTFSEYFDDVPPGGFREGIQCQDVERLTYADASFDLCTSTEVFEHVPDDMRGFAEIARVLRKGGMFLFTVPLSGEGRSVERAHRAGDGSIAYLLPPVYHGDRLRGRGKVLCYRDYGNDILERLLASGFSRSELILPERSRWWGMGRPVVMAIK